MGFIIEFAQFIKQRKKYVLLPVLVMALILGGLLLVTEGSAIAPFIYATF
jgi:hypothetical protein